MNIDQKIDEICSFALLGGEYTRLDEFDAGVNHLQDAVERMKWGNYAVSEDRKTLRHYEHLLRVAPKLRKKLKSEIEA
jgi:hypothetical protein